MTAVGEERAQSSPGEIRMDGQGLDDDGVNVPLTRRLQQAVADGDGDRAASEHRQLVRTIDKAAAHHALHRNAAARKKAQAARLLGGS